MYVDHPLFPIVGKRWLGSSVAENIPGTTSDPRRMSMSEMTNNRFLFMGVPLKLGDRRGRLYTDPLFLSVGARLVHLPACL